MYRKTIFNADEEFSAVLQKDMDDAQAGRTRPAKEAFTDLRRELS